MIDTMGAGILSEIRPPWDDTQPNNAGATIQIMSTLVSFAPRRRWTTPIFAVLMLGFAASLTLGASAAAADDDGTVTWAVSPSSAEGPDGRAWMELQAAPGDTISEDLAVRNFGKTEVTFSLSAADGYFTPTGRFNMLQRDQQSVGAGVWIDVQEKVTVAPGGVAVVPFTIEVPDNATPGDHAAGIAASIFSAGSGDGASIGVESRVGFRVLTRVSGEIAPGLVVDETDAVYTRSWNPLKPGSVLVTYTLENTGNVRMAVSGHAGPLAEGSALTETAELLPGDRRVFTVDVADVWPLGLVTIPLTINQASVDLTGDAGELPDLRSDVAVWAMPWPQLIVLLGILLLIGGLMWDRRRRTKKFTSLLSKAREEGHRAALIQSATPRSDLDDRVRLLDPDGNEFDPDGTELDLSNNSLDLSDNSKERYDPRP